MYLFTEYGMFLIFLIKCFKLINVNNRTNELQYKKIMKLKKDFFLTPPGIEPLTKERPKYVPINNKECVTMVLNSSLDGIYLFSFWRFVAQSTVVQTNSATGSAIAYHFIIIKN